MYMLHILIFSIPRSLLPTTLTQKKPPPSQLFIPLVPIRRLDRHACGSIHWTLATYKWLHPQGKVASFLQNQKASNGSLAKYMTLEVIAPSVLKFKLL